METGTAIVLGLGAGLGAWWLLMRKPAAAPPPPAYGSGGSYNPAGMYTGSDLGPLSPILSVPGAAPIYNVLAPINDKLLQPIVNDINTSGIVQALNKNIGGTPTVTVNADGTITRKAPDNWYSDNIGKPISHAGTAVVNAISSIW